MTLYSESLEYLNKQCSNKLQRGIQLLFKQPPFELLNMSKIIWLTYPPTYSKTNNACGCIVVLTIPAIY